MFKNVQSTDKKLFFATEAQIHHPPQPPRRNRRHTPHASPSKPNSVVASAPPRPVLTGFSQVLSGTEAVKGDAVTGDPGPKMKKNGKPSRRWLSRQVDVLNAQLHEKEKKELQWAEMKARYENELAHWRNGPSSSGPTQRERIQILTQDVFILKNLVVKLNRELERYQDRLLQAAGSAVLPTDSEEPDSRSRADWIPEELTPLKPLLTAFEESVREKETLIRNANSDMLRLSQTIKELVKENEKLRQSELESREKGEVNFSDWLTLQKECATYKEQNSLLLRQAKLHQNKQDTLKESFQSKLDEVVCERDGTIQRLNQTKHELNTVKARLSVLTTEFDKLKEEEDKKVPHSVHTAYIAECKRLFEELKRRYEDERESLLRKTAYAESKLSETERQASQAIFERNELRVNLQELGVQVKALKEATEKAVKERDSLKTRLSSAVQFSQELIAQEEKLMKELKQRTEESQLGSQLATRVESLKGEVKSIEVDTLRQMQLLDSELRGRAQIVSRIKEGFHEEISRLRGLLDEKEQRLVQLSKPKERLLNEQKKQFST